MSANVSGLRVRLVSPASAAVLFALTMAAAVASLPLAVLARQAAGSSLTYHAAVTLLTLVLGGVGVVVAWHQPRNPLGWLLLGSGTCFALQADASFYATLAYRLHPGGLPVGWVAVLLEPSWGLAIVFLSMAVLLFPDGRLLSRHWWWPVRIYVAMAVLAVGGAVVIAVMAIAGHRIRINSSGDLAIIDDPTGAAAPWGAIKEVCSFILVVCLVAAVIQQAVSYRRASGERRQQLKWVASGAVVSLTCGVAATVLNNTAGVWQMFSDVMVAGLAALPASMGVAVLRYRLYEIDRIISRTLAYAIVTGLLIGVYAGLVLLATRVLSFHTPVAVAASTLAAAALFNPLRRRVQYVVDRRFHRARYDADLVVAAFAARLKDAVDLDSVRDDLVGVVHQALEPAYVSVWISQRD